MSLLMDALKKAEKAKQGTGGESSASAPTTAAGQSAGPATEWPVLSVDLSPAEIESELGFAPAKAKSPSAAPEPTPVSQKPATTISLEPLHSGAAPALAAATPETKPPSQPLAAQGAAAATPNASQQAVERLAAKSVFSAKRPATGVVSRAPFLAIMGALLLVGAGGAYYFWSQLQGPTAAPAARPAGAVIGVINAPTTAPLANAAPPSITQAPVATSQTPTPAQPAPAPPLAPAASVALVAPAATPASPGPPAAANSTARTETKPTPATTVPAVPTTAAARGPASSAAQPPPMVAGTQSRGTAEGSRSATAASARGGVPVESPSGLRISRDRAPTGIDPAVAAGYAALAEGNVEAARDHYSRALAADDANRDALLGMATIALRGGSTHAAQGLYLRVLELYPRDAYASAQLSALRSGSDAAGAESRVRSLLANDPDRAGAAPLHFALGNQMAAQNRWPEAQQAYFNAFAAEPDNPDYCFNLAVSLDQIRQPKLAFEHYARALELAQKRRPGFDVARAKARLDQLAISAK